MNASFSTSSVLPRTAVEGWMRQLQDWLCYRLEAADGGGTFGRDDWTLADGGAGCTRVLQHGAVLEKGGLACSAVWGTLSKQAARQLQLPHRRYFTTSLNVVQHPRSPQVPISHFTVRYFEADNGVAWFGGGLDLTPVYVDARQARWFHEQLQDVCARHDGSYYSRFKQEADAHFYLPHRQETRGVGGLFFDRLTVGRDGLFEELFAFVQDVGEAYGRTYCTLLRQNAARPYTEREKQWQRVRRGRCAEFSLALDCGTRFGLATGSRPESILLGLPPQADWCYHHPPEPGSAEAATLRWLRPGIDWLSAGGAT